MHHFKYFSCFSMWYKVLPSLEQDTFHVLFLDFYSIVVST